MRIPRTAFAVAMCSDSENSRYAIGGALIERIDHSICRATATDGRILACVQWQEDEHVEADHVADTRAVIPLKVCNQVARLVKPSPTELRKKEATQYVSMQEVGLNGKAVFCAESSKGKQKLEVDTIAGRFPQYDKVFPSGGDTVSVMLDPALLAKLLTAVGTAGECNPDHRGIILTVRDNKTAVTVSRIDRETGRKVAGAIMPMEFLNKNKKPVLAEWFPDGVPCGGITVGTEEGGVK